MNSLSETVSFAFSNLTSDGASLLEPWEVYLRFVGTFCVTIGGRTLYSEESFCLVEFGVLSYLWLKEAESQRQDFLYSSLESEEHGLLSIKRCEGGWRLDSLHQKFESDELFPLSIFEVAITDYFCRLRAIILARFSIDILAVVQWAEASVVLR
jgi:hypothetical protein